MACSDVTADLSSESLSDSGDEDDNAEGHGETGGTSAAVPPPSTPSPSAVEELAPGKPRYEAFAASVAAEFERTPDAAITGLDLNEVFPSILGRTGPFTFAEAEHVIREMEQRNLVMYEGGVMYPV